MYEGIYLVFIRSLCIFCWSSNKKCCLWCIHFRILSCLYDLF